MKKIIFGYLFGTFLNGFVSFDRLIGSPLFVAGTARCFFGKCVSVQGGVGYCRARLEANIAAKQTNEEVTIDVTTDNLVFYLAIGNQLSFDSGFTVSCDWIAVSIPIIKTWKSPWAATGFRILKLILC